MSIIEQMDEDYQVIDNEDGTYTFRINNSIFNVSDQSVSELTMRIESDAGNVNIIVDYAKGKISAQTALLLMLRSPGDATKTPFNAKYIVEPPEGVTVTLTLDGVDTVIDADNFKYRSSTYGTSTGSGAGAATVPTMIPFQPNKTMNQKVRTTGGTTADHNLMPHMVIEFRHPNTGDPDILNAALNEAIAHARGR